MRTPVCELLGIEPPIVLAPMVAVPRLAAAVSKAGALGMLALTWSVATLPLYSAGWPPSIPSLPPSMTS
jgi:NAD(P)H-dependent flavin oxidoreductase YrpB (nitropropane dioxygenase family)